MKTGGGLVLGGLLMLVLMLGVGCTYVQRGAAIGAGGGAIVGGLIASTNGILNAGEGAAVGAAGGGLAGALIGDQFQQKKVNELKAEIDNLRSQIAAKDELVSQKDKSLEKLQRELAQKENQLRNYLQQLSEKDRLLSAKDQQLSQKDRQLAQLKRDYEEKLKNIKSMEDKLKELEVKLEQTPKGLELTMLGSALFASGKDELTSEGKTLLNKVAQIVKQHFPNKEILVEGHTDSQEIKYSGWKSNWELGAARALAVLHYLVDTQGFNPAKMSAITYSKYRPVADNETPEGRQQNRRAVVIILPEVKKSYKHFASE
ncbi:OmpA family protein [Candidatus Sumerlaeota bacterium]|nr:OmpA family protein [Candidatus Sumerlaeota bacterium]